MKPRETQPPSSMSAFASLLPAWPGDGVSWMFTLGSGLPPKPLMSTLAGFRSDADVDGTCPAGCVASTAPVGVVAVVPCVALGPAVPVVAPVFMGRFGFEMTGMSLSTTEAGRLAHADVVLTAHALRRHLEL